MIFRFDAAPRKEALRNQGFFLFCLELQRVEDSSLIGAHSQKNDACPKIIEKTDKNLDIKFLQLTFQLVWEIGLFVLHPLVYGISSK